MNKTSCNIIKDILPLYVDEVVCEDTRNMVSEHLEHCGDCRSLYEEMKADVSIPIDNSTKSLKKFKSAWKRKKVILVCTTLIVAMAVMCCALLAVEHFVYEEKIAVNGAVYTQNGRNISALPADSTEIGYLRGISFWSTSNPTEDFMATNLDGKYGGCPIYQSGKNDEIIYLEDYSGFFIPFMLSEYIPALEIE